MYFNDKDEVFRQCEELGEIGAKAYLDSGQAGPDSRWVMEWLSRLASHRQIEISNNEALAREKQRREDRVQLERSIGASERSAKWTMIAAIAAAASVIVPIIVNYFH